MIALIETYPWTAALGAIIFLTASIGVAYGIYTHYKGKEDTNTTTKEDHR